MLYEDGTVNQENLRWAKNHDVYICRGGKASWAFDHASDYAIVIDKESHEPMTFTDVPDTAYYAEAVNWAVAKKITNGKANGLFGSNDPCTRAQIVTFLYRAYQGK